MLGRCAFLETQPPLARGGQQVRSIFEHKSIHQGLENRSANGRRRSSTSFASWRFKASPRALPQGRASADRAAWLVPHKMRWPGRAGGLAGEHEECTMHNVVVVVGARCIFSLAPRWAAPPVPSGHTTDVENYDDSDQLDRRVGGAHPAVFMCVRWCVYHNNMKAVFVFLKIITARNKHTGDVRPDRTRRRQREGKQHSAASTLSMRPTCGRSQRPRRACRRRCRRRTPPPPPPPPPPGRRQT